MAGRVDSFNSAQSNLNKSMKISNQTKHIISKGHK
jgi:hypothetical protein